LQIYRAGLCGDITAPWYSHAPKSEQIVVEAFQLFATSSKCSYMCVFDFVCTCLRLCLRVCMYVCACMCLRVSQLMRVLVSRCANVSVSLSLSLSLSLSIPVHIRVHLRMCACSCVCVCVRLRLLVSVPRGVHGETNSHLQMYMILEWLGVFTTQTYKRVHFLIKEKCSKNTGQNGLYSVEHENKKLKRQYAQKHLLNHVHIFIMCMYIYIYIYTYI